MTPVNAGGSRHSHNEIWLPTGRQLSLFKQESGVNVVTALSDHLGEHASQQFRRQNQRLRQALSQFLKKAHHLSAINIDRLANNERACIRDR